jgi:precorrin-6A/cobalt-precorrin-6A reductase
MAGISAARVLILGGTAEARAIASTLHQAGVDVVSSLAGRVADPRLPVGRVRLGGFGGVEGLVDYLRDQQISHLVDATHPFATTMTAHAVAAAVSTGVAMVRFVRPGWAAHPDASQWHWVPGYPQARELAERLADRPFITTGRQTLPHFSADWADRSVLVRVVEQVDGLPPSWRVVLDRGPYEVDAERRLMADHRVGVLLTKDSGGSYTAAKLSAAAQLGVPVVVVARPVTPEATVEVATVEQVIDQLGLPTVAAP